MTSLRMFRAAAIALAIPALLLAGCGGGGGGGGGVTQSGSASVTISPATLPPPSVGVAYSTSLSASGAVSPYIFKVGGGALPTGLHLNGVTGLIDGTPSKAGLFGVTITAVASNGDFGQESYSLLVVDPVTITTTSLAAGEERVAYSQRVDAHGGVGPYTWTVASGALPQGLALSASSGLSVQVNGLPTAPVASAGFDLRVQDGQGRSAVKHFTISIANTYRVFLTADLDTAGVNELYEVVLDDNLQPRAPVKISGTINPSDGDVFASFQLSPDGKKIAYIADAGFDGVVELFVVDVSTGTPGPARKVNSAFTNLSGKAKNVRWSPDSTKIAWVADAAFTNDNSLYFADVSGATITQRQANPVTTAVLAGVPGVGPNSGTTAEDFAWSFDSRYLAFEADGRSSNRTQPVRSDAYVCDTATPLGQTPTATRVNLPNLTTNGSVAWVQWAPGKLVLVFADSGAVTTTITPPFPPNIVPCEVYTVVISGSASATSPVTVTSRPVTCNTGLSSPGIGSGCDFSPDGTRLALFYGSGSVPGSPSGALYLAPVTASGLGTPVLVTFTPFIDQSTASQMNGYAWSPDSHKLLVSGFLQTSAIQTQLATCDVSGAVPGPLVPIPMTQKVVASTFPYSCFGFTPDSSSYTYANGTLNPVFGDLDFLRVSATPAALPQQISGAITAVGFPCGVPQSAPCYWFSPDSQQVVYISEQSIDNQVELFAVEVGGNLPGPAIQVSPTPANVNGDVQAVPQNGSSVAVLGAIPSLAVPQWSSDSRFLLFRGDLVVDERYDLRLWDSTQVGAPVTTQVVPSLASTPGTPLGVTGFKIVD